LSPDGDGSLKGLHRTQSTADWCEQPRNLFGHESSNSQRSVLTLIVAHEELLTSAPASDAVDDLAGHSKVRHARSLRTS